MLRAGMHLDCGEVPYNGMASVGGDMAGDDRDDFGIGALGSHTTNRAWSDSGQLLKHPNFTH